MFSFRGFNSNVLFSVSWEHETIQAEDEQTDTRLMMFCWRTCIYREGILQPGHYNWCSISIHTLHLQDHHIVYLQLVASGFHLHQQMFCPSFCFQLHVSFWNYFYVFSFKQFTYVLKISFCFLSGALKKYFLRYIDSLL